MLHDLIKIIMKVDMHLYDCMIIQILLIYLFIYLPVYLFSYFDSCFEKIYFIKNIFERTVERATWWVSPGLLRNSID